MVDVSEATMATVVPAGVKGPVNRALIRYCEWLAEKLQISYPKVWGLLSEYTHSKGMEVAGTFQLGPINGRPRIRNPSLEAFANFMGEKIGIVWHAAKHGYIQFLKEQGQNEPGCYIAESDEEESEITPSSNVDHSRAVFTAPPFNVDKLHFVHDPDLYQREMKKADTNWCQLSKELLPAMPTNKNKRARSGSPDDDDSTPVVDSEESEKEEKEVTVKPVKKRQRKAKHTTVVKSESASTALTAASSRDSASLHTTAPAQSSEIPKGAAVTQAAALLPAVTSSQAATPTQSSEIIRATAVLLAAGMNEAAALLQANAPIQVAVPIRAATPAAHTQVAIPIRAATPTAHAQVTATDQAAAPTQAATSSAPTQTDASGTTARPRTAGRSGTGGQPGAAVRPQTGPGPQSPSAASLPYKGKASSIKFEELAIKGIIEKGDRMRVEHNSQNGLFATLTYLHHNGKVSTWAASFDAALGIGPANISGKGPQEFVKELQNLGFKPLNASRISSHVRVMRGPIDMGSITELKEDLLP